MKRYAVIGAGGCGRGVMPFFSEQVSKIESSGEYDLVFVDDQLAGTIVNNRAVLSYKNWLSLSASHRYAVIAISNGQIRYELSKQLYLNHVNVFEARASNVVQFDEVKIGEGSVLCPFVTITSNIVIGRFFHANLYSYVEHDCVIGDFVTFAPGVMCNGNVVIEDHAYIGSGAIIRQGLPGKPLIIGKGATIGMGAVVTKSVPPGITVVGNPARPILK